MSNQHRVKTPKNKAMGNMVILRWPSYMQKAEELDQRVEQSIPASISSIKSYKSFTSSDEEDQIQEQIKSQKDNKIQEERHENDQQILK